MAREIPAALKTAGNAAVLAYLAGLSAHDEVAQALTQAVESLGDVQAFTPDAAQYRYVAVSTRGVIFGFAPGMAMVSQATFAVISASVALAASISTPEGAPATSAWMAARMVSTGVPERDASTRTVRT